MIPAFVMTCCSRDVHLARRTLEQIRRFYPRAEIVLILDGSVPDAPRALATVVLESESLNDTTRPTAWLERMLKAVLEYSSSEVICKLDPDAYLTRRFKTPFPPADLFGTLYADGTVQGGCYGLRRSAAQAIVKSEVLERSELQLVNLRSALHSNEERQISVACRLLGHRLESWGEVCCKAPPQEWSAAQRSSRYAVWHPVKTL